MNLLLTEVERHDGIIIMATNRWDPPFPPGIMHSASQPRPQARQCSATVQDGACSAAAGSWSPHRVATLGALHSPVLQVGGIILQQMERLMEHTYVAA